ncbi:hypothetical protein XENOCAPTIV_027435, partial [Xenoophorus captivus]
HYIDLTDPRWACPELKLRPRLNLFNSPIIDLTVKETKETKPDTKDIFQNGDSQLEQGIRILNGQDFKLENSSGVSHVFPPQQDCGTQKPKQRCLNSPTQPENQNPAIQASQDAPDVKLDQLSFLESHVKILETSGCCVQLTKDSPHMSLCFKQNNNGEAQTFATSLEITPSTLNVSHMESMAIKCPEVRKSAREEPETLQKHTSKLLQDQATQDLQIPARCPNAKEGHDDSTLRQHTSVENNLDGFHSSDRVPSTFKSLTQDKTAICSNLEKLDLYNSEYGQRCPSDHPSSHSPHIVEADSVSHTSCTPLNHTNQGGQSPRSDYTPGENTLEWELETLTYREDAGDDSPMSLPWQGDTDREDMNEESRFCTDFRAVSREDRRHVCSITLEKLTSGHQQVL